MFPACKNNDIVNDLHSAICKPDLQSVQEISSSQCAGVLSILVTSLGHDHAHTVTIVIAYLAPCQAIFSVKKKHDLFKNGKEHNLDALMLAATLLIHQQKPTLKICEYLFQNGAEPYETMALNSFCTEDVIEIQLTEHQSNTLQDLSESAFTQLEQRGVSRKEAKIRTFIAREQSKLKASSKHILLYLAHFFRKYNQQDGWKKEAAARFILWQIDALTYQKIEYKPIYSILPTFQNPQRGIGNSKPILQELINGIDQLSDQVTHQYRERAKSKLKSFLYAP